MKKNNKIKINNILTNQQDYLIEKVPGNKTPDENIKYFYGGFIEGEGSLCCSYNLSKQHKFRVYPRIEFNVCQHVNGIHILRGIRSIFLEKGYIYSKSGSDKVWVYKLQGVENIRIHVIPFYQKYIIPYSGKLKEFNIFLEILERMERKEHHTREGLLEIITLGYTLNTEGKGRTRKRTIEELREIIFRD